MFLSLLKKMTDFYNKRGSPVYLGFLDAKKAFDWMNYWILLSILLGAMVQTYLVDLLAFWYVHQGTVAQWGNASLEVFKSCHGIRQGGIPSLYL